MTKPLDRSRFLRVAFASAVGGFCVTVLAYAALGLNDSAFEGSLAIIGSALALVWITYWTWSAKERRRYYALALLVWWVAAEQLAAPFLGSTLSMWHYGIMQDIDHRPVEHGNGYNADSLRATAEPEEFQADGLNLLFIGDSFTFGAGVEGEEAFPHLVGRRFQALLPQIDVKVANFGWISSSPLLSARLLERIGERYAPQLVVACIDMTDFGDDIRYQMMFDRSGLYAWYDRLPMSLNFFSRLAPTKYQDLLSWSVGGAPKRRFFITESPLSETRRWFEPLVGNLHRIHDWCRQHSAEFIVVILPRFYQYTDRECPDNWECDEYEIMGPHCLDPFRYFAELEQEVDFKVVSLLEEFRSASEFPLCFPYDPHWNAQGHQVAARAIAKALAPIVERRIQSAAPQASGTSRDQTLPPY